MPADSNSRSKRSAPRRRQIVQALWPLAILLLVFAWNSTACKKKEQPGARKKGAPSQITYHYPTPQPTYTFRPGVTPNIQPE
ncbi:MAG TPA: hypothetical protein VGO79_06665 [Thermoanaerobaculia bacterium]|jgi:hypothetical protein